MKFLLVTIGLLLISSVLFCQDFLVNQPQVIKSPKVPLFLSEHIAPLKKERSSYNYHFSEGTYNLLENNYNVALSNFIQAYKVDPSSANINYLVGMCYMRSSVVQERAKSIRYLEKACMDVTKHHYAEFTASEKQAPILAYYYLGLANHLNYKFDEALDAFRKFKELSGSAKTQEVADAERMIVWCATAKKLMSNPVSAKITNLGDSINSSFADYNAVISADEQTLIFTSRREGPTGGDQDLFGQYNEDLYIAHKKTDGTWSRAVSIGDSITTVNNEASVALSPDGTELIFYRSDAGGALVFSKSTGNKWSRAKPLGIGTAVYSNTKDWVPSVSLNKDGSIIYFVSDRAGGLGGKDIWKSVKQADGRWGTPVNVGAPINSKYDEDTPFINPEENTIWFSSNRPESMGGFDIFSANKGADGTWSAPQNIGYPINTPGDDLFYVSSPDGKHGYFSSIRKGGFGDKDIYMITK